MSKLSNKYNKGQKMIPRFALAPRLAHWTYVASFCILLLTGLPKLFKGGQVNFLYSVFGGASTAMLIHRIAGVVMIVSVILTALFAWKNFWKWGRELFDWKKRDAAFLKVFPKEFFGFHAEYPPQGYLNGGTKINSILQVICFAGFSFSGIFMWFPKVLPTGFQTWMYPMHIIFVCLAAAVVVGHIYLAVLHPNAKGGLQGMTKGYVPESYAREHHGAWLAEVEEENAKLPKDKKIVKDWDDKDGKVI